MPRLSTPVLLTTAVAVLLAGGALLLWPVVAGGADAELERKKKALTAALEEYAAADAPDFAVAIVDNRTGASYDFRGDQAFETASIVKVDILAATLLRAQEKDRELTEDERADADKMITISDNDAATALFKASGGAEGLTAANAKIGLTATEADPRWGFTRTTPKDQVTLVSTLLLEGGPFNEYARTTATELMTSVVDEQDWGVTAAAREGETTALKNGWDSRSKEDGRWIANSVGRITGDGVDLSIAVLTHGNASFEDGVPVVEKIAKLTRDQLEW